jgi:4-diphosphocytidyl-2-C-methyl-D-erythritol kinase
MSAITLLSPAKINLTLDILGVRPDGYHELCSIIQPIDFFDEVSIEIGDGEGISLESSGIEIPPGRDNLAWKAADMYLGESGLSQSVKIHIKKRIPPGSGLGGGSGNAAAALVGLNKLTGALTEEKLLKIASRIGADVSFFIRSQSGVAEGIGEKITLLRDFPLFYYLVLCPKLHISTQEIYNKWDELHSAREHNSLNTIEPNIRNIVSIFKDTDKPPPLRNDLEEAAIELYPEISSYKKILSSMGAESVMMTGSGSAVYALFRKEDEAVDAYDYLKTSPTFKSVLAGGVKGWHFVI